MSVWAIGDLQGCYDATQRLLERIALRSGERHAVVLRRPGQPRRPVAGNAAPGAFAARQQRGRARQPRPVAARDRRTHAGRAAQGQSRPARVRVAPTIATNCSTWLRMQELLHVDRELGWMMVHAGLAPKWTTTLAEKHAREVEAAAARRRLPQAAQATCTATSPTWSPQLAGIDRSRAIINMFTRMRYCTPRGRIAFEEKGAPGHAGAGPVSRGTKCPAGRSAT